MPLVKLSPKITRMEAPAGLSKMGIASHDLVLWQICV